MSKALGKGKLYMNGQLVSDVSGIEVNVTDNDLVSRSYVDNRSHHHSGHAIDFANHTHSITASNIFLTNPSSLTWGNTQIATTPYVSSGTIANGTIQVSDEFKKYMYQYFFDNKNEVLQEIFKSPTGEDYSIE